MKRYSLIMPVLNAASRLEEVLTPLLQLGPEWQVLLMDDGSSDGTQELLRSYPFQVYHQPERSGQSAARNRAARLAEGDILIFLDSDVVVEPETLPRMAALLEERHELDGVFGCYSSEGNPGESPVSRFRNLLHRHVHQSSAGPVGTFWAGLGAIRRHSFLEGGSFDSRLDGIEDVELGVRISRRGGRFWLEPDFEGRHLKRWSLSSMIHTDIWIRAAQWVYYGWRGITPKAGLNLSPRFSLPPMLLVLGLFLPLWSGPAAGACWLVYLLLNFPVYRCCAAAAGWRVGLLSVFYLLVHHGCCLTGATLGTLRYLKFCSRRS
jgi:glycosyltransferase involved in cell wall biosynthesis